MKYSNVCIEAVAGEIPKNIVSSQAIEERLLPLYERLEIPMGSLERLTGIRERRFWDLGTTPSQGSAWAGEKALHLAEISPDRIGCLFHCANSRDYLEPSTATVVHQKLGISKRAMVFDISNANLSFMNGVLAAANLIELGQTDAALIVSSEYSQDEVESGVNHMLQNPTKELFYSAFPSLTLGDGAVAMVLTHRKISRTGHRLVGGTVRFEDVPHWPGFSSSLEAQINYLWKKRFQLVKEAWQHFMTLINWTPEIVQKTFHHVLDPKGSILQLLNLNRSQNFSVTEQFGNLISIGAPMALAKELEDKKCLVKGDCFALLGLGFDLNCLMLGAVWN